MVIGLTLVNVYAVLSIIRGNYVTGIAGTDVAAVRDVVTLVRATATIVHRAVLIMI